MIYLTQKNLSKMSTFGIIKSCVYLHCNDSKELLLIFS